MKKMQGLKITEFLSIKETKKTQKYCTKKGIKSITN
jgi:hypothetical protein